MPIISVSEPGLPFHLLFLKLFMEYSIENTNRYKRKSKLMRNAIIVLCICIVLAVVSFFSYRFVVNRLYAHPSFHLLRHQWESYDYPAVYETSHSLLERAPFNNTARTYHGYAAFYLGVSALDTSNAQGYLDEAINNLRIALMSAKQSLVPQLEYMLGKAYFYKNTVSSYYYSDLAIKYLKQAREHGYKADDIPEYLGLSYAALDMTMDSITSFTEALLARESDALLLSIAEQYYKIGQHAAAEQYLFRVIKDCDDKNLVLQSRMLLGTIYTDEEKYAEAEKEFLSILEEDKNFADAYYELGALYEKQGDIIKARAEWRRALRIQVNHQKALKKLSE